MAKKKRAVADRVRGRKTDSQKRTNPFEVKVNRQKHHILGRKLPKHDKGTPGVSRSKAIKMRKETLLQEYNQRFKVNQLLDRRLGEHDVNLSGEEKMLKRYAMERERNTGGSKFNLNEGEELTHYGQSLSDITKFDEPDLSEDEEDSGKIGGHMVATEHFGGFLTRRDPNKEDDADRKTWKEKMEEVITNSKRAKYERQSEREKAMELTVELDEQWKNVSVLLGEMAANKAAKETSKPPLDEYDITVRELKYELKGKATNRLKTEEDLAKEDKERLEKQEADRVRRMKGIVVDADRQQTHHSADSLDDGFDLVGHKKERRLVTFKDGKMVVEEDEGDDENGAEDEEADEENEAEESEEEGEEDNKDGETSEEEDGDDSDGEDGSDDSHSDVMSDSDDVEDTTDTVAVPKLQTKSILKKKPETEEDRKTKESMKSAAKQELPYTFTAPDSYDALMTLLRGRCDTDQLTVIDRIRKCHHASLADGNKLKMEMLLRLLVQYYGSLAVCDPPSLSLLDRLTTPIYELTQTFPGVAGGVFQRLVQRRQEDFSQMRERKRSGVITLDTLLYLKLVSVLFPTSDFQHPVTTPALLFISQLLSQSPVTTERAVAVGLFLCNLCLEYVSLSKKFVPEVVRYLHGVLFLAANKDPNTIERLSGPIKPVGKSVNLLHLSNKKSRKCKVTHMKMSEVFGGDVDKDSLSSPEFRLGLLHCSVRLLEEFSDLYAGLPSHHEIFSPVLHMCSKLPTERYPAQVQESISSLVNRLKERHKPKQPLVFNKQKPKPLKMFEPQIEESWDGHKKKGGPNKTYNDKQRLVHKVKKELKGAMREIRKDTQFLAQHQLQEVMAKDSERKRKVKNLFGNLANQEGDYNSLKRKKKK